MITDFLPFPSLSLKLNHKWDEANGVYEILLGKILCEPFTVYKFNQTFCRYEAQDDQFKSEAKNKKRTVEKNFYDLYMQLKKLALMKDLQNANCYSY